MPLLFRVLCLVSGVLLAALTAPRPARAAPGGAPPKETVREKCCDAPPNAAALGRAIVHVDAYEYASLGVVVGARDLVLVPYHVIEVDRPGRVSEIVVDARGERHTAVLRRTDRAAGLALLQLDAPLRDAEPLEVRTEPGAPRCQYTPPGLDGDGAPVVDETGRLFALVEAPAWRGVRLILAAPARRMLERPAFETVARRSLIFYASTGGLFEFLGDEGLLGIGQAFGIAARYRDLLELRLDASYTFLVRRRRPSEGPGAHFSGLRWTHTPSVGTRIHLGGPRAWSTAITPNIGCALGVEIPPIQGEPVRTSALLAPGISFTVGPGELRARVRLPRGETTTPTLEVAIGLTF